MESVIMATISRNNQGIDYVSQLKQPKIPLSIKIMRSYIKILGLISKKRSVRKLIQLFLTPNKKPLDDSTLDYYHKDKTIIKSYYHQYNHKDILVQERGAGPRVLLVHGWGSSSYRMRSITDVLIKNNFQVITFDLPAHGLSEGKMTNIKECSTLVDELASKYQPLKAVIGHSFGGTTVLFNETKSYLVETIITISSPTKLDSFIEPFFNLFEVKEDTQNDFLKELQSIVQEHEEKFAIYKRAKPVDIPLHLIHDIDDDIIPVNNASDLEGKPNVNGLFLTNRLGHRLILKDESVQNHIISILSK
jgi:esterase/lipase